MPDYKNVYRDGPELYDELVSAEDVDGNLRRAILHRCDVTEKTVVEAGAGTGRLTRILLESGAARVVATELEPAMLALAEQSLQNYGVRLECVVADARTLPVEDNCADLGIAGWVFGHFRSWMADNWKEEVGAALQELERATRLGGTVIVIETLGTGTESPAPAPGLLEYYEWLEERGYTRISIRTDYLFASVEDAERVTGAFFGQEFAVKVRERKWQRVPECTGIWSKTLDTQ